MFSELFSINIYQCRIIPLLSIKEKSHNWTNFKWNAITQLEEIEVWSRTRLWSNVIETRWILF